MMTRFATAVSAMTLAAFVSSTSRADEFALLQDWFTKPESTRGEVPAQVQETLKIGLSLSCPST